MTVITIYSYTYLYCLANIFSLCGVIKPAYIIYLANMKSEKIACIAFLVLAIFISLVLGAIPFLISHSGSSLPDMNYHMEGFTEQEAQMQLDVARQRVRDAEIMVNQATREYQTYMQNRGNPANPVTPDQAQAEMRYKENVSRSQMYLDIARQGLEQAENVYRGALASRATPPTRPMPPMMPTRPPMQPMPPTRPPMQPMMPTRQQPMPPMPPMMPTRPPMQPMPTTRPPMPTTQPPVPTRRLPASQMGKKFR